MIGYEDLRERMAAIELERDIVVVRGPEAETYLQGQLSQDVSALAPGESALSLLLEPQGKIDAFVRVTRRGAEDFLLDTDAGSGPAVVARLGRFKLRTKVDIAPLEGWRCVAVRGPGAPGGAPNEWQSDGAVTTAFAWPGLAGVDLLGPDVAVPAGIPGADLEAFEVRRIESGLPAPGRELDDRTIPEETGMVAATVSFTKGCYTGQELVARIDSRGGNVPRRLRGLRMDAGAVPSGAELWADTNGEERSAGVVTSVARHPAGGQVGLAYVKRGFAEMMEAEARWDGGAARVAVSPLPLDR